MRTGLYVRVSTTERAKEGYSIGEQEERLRNYCKAKGWHVYDVYVDGGYSGASTERPGLQRLLKDLEKGLFDIVLVYKLDRLSRSQKDTMELIEDVFMPKNIDFVSMTENLDTTTPVGMAMIGLLSVFAQLERAQIAERMEIGREGRAKEGKWHGAKCSPVGYEYKDDQLHVLEYEAMMLREAFEMAAQRVSLRKISMTFKERGYKHRYGYFIPSSMKRMLRNKLYVGYIEKNGKIYEGQHTPIVSQELFDRVQRVFKEAEQTHPNRKGAYKYNSHLGGLLICKHCGGKYCRDMGKPKADGTKTKFYSCYSRNKKSPEKIKDPACRNKIWLMDELDNLVFNEITKLAFDHTFIENIQVDYDDGDKQRQLDLITKRIDDITEQISRYSDLYSLKSLTMDEVKAKIEPLGAERDSLQEELEYLQEQTDSSVEEIYELAKSFGEYLNDSDSDKIRFVIEELIDRIVLDNENITIHWKFA